MMVLAIVVMSALQANTSPAATLSAGTSSLQCIDGGGYISGEGGLAVGGYVYACVGGTHSIDETLPNGPSASDEGSRGCIGIFDGSGSHWKCGAIPDDAIALDPTLDSGLVQFSLFNDYANETLTASFVVRGSGNRSITENFDQSVPTPDPATPQQGGVGASIGLARWGNIDPGGFVSSSSGAGGVIQSGNGRLFVSAGAGSSLAT